MTDYSGFKGFLVTKYKTKAGTSLSGKVANNYGSRLRRVEKILGLDVAQALKRHGLEFVIEEFNRKTEASKMVRGRGRYDYRTAVRAYSIFLSSSSK